MSSGSSAASNARPGAIWLALLSAIALGPLWLRLAGSEIGSFAMFTHAVRYRLTITKTLADGRRALVPGSRLAPHLGRDARRIVVPATHGFVGETQVALLAHGLDDIGALVCKLEPDANSVALDLERAAIDQTPLASERARVSCETAR